MNKKLEPCPFCHAEAKVGYACGDYFMYCSEDCPSPACDHPSESTTICSWNDWAKWYRNRRAATEANEPLTLDSRLTPKTVTCPKGWQGIRDTRFYCPDCKKAVRKGEAYCHKCGQALIFPVERYDKENNRIWLDFSDCRPPEGETK